MADSAVLQFTLQCPLYKYYGCHILGLCHLKSYLLVGVDMSVWLQVVVYWRGAVENSYSDQNLIISMKIILNWGGVHSEVFLCWAVCLHQTSPSLLSVSWDQCKIKWPTLRHLVKLADLNGGYFFKFTPPELTHYKRLEKLYCADEVFPLWECVST